MARRGVLEYAAGRRGCGGKIVGGGAMSPILLNSPSRSTFPQVFELSYDAESSRGRDPAETSATALQPSSEVQDLREGYVGVQADVIGYN